MFLLKAIPYAVLVILAIIFMVMAGGVGFIATGLMNVALFFDEQAGEIRDNK